MRSQEMYHLQQSAKEIRVAIDTDGDRIGGKLNEQHPLPVDGGQPAFDYRQHMQNVNTQLGSAEDRAVEAENRHSAQLIRVVRLKSERDEVAKTNRDKLMASRQILENLYPSGGFELANVSGDTPRVPEKLYEQLGQTVQLFREPAVDLRKVKVKGVNVDFDEVASDLETGMLDLNGAIDGLDGDRKKAEGTLVVKQKAIEDFRRTILWVGRTTEGLFHLAGEDELAKRIRSSTRRPARPSEQAAQPPAEEPGSGEESSSESQATSTPTQS